jgi:hypothetical protein
MAVILASAYATASNLESSFVAIIFPPLISGIFTIWLWFGAIVGIIGLVLFFIRKEQYNRAK